MLIPKIYLDVWVKYAIIIICYLKLAFPYSKLAFLTQNLLCYSKLAFLTQNSLLLLETCFSFSKHTYLLETHFCYSKLAFLTQNLLFLLETRFFNLKLTFLTQNSLSLLNILTRNSTTIIPQDEADVPKGKIIKSC